MATNVRDITTEAWQIITSKACTFQVLGDREVKITESVGKPEIDTKDYKIALPKNMYTFDPNDCSLYALAVDTNNAIGYDLI